MELKCLFLCFITFYLSLTSYVSASGFVPEEVFGTVVGSGISNMNHNAVRQMIKRFKDQNFLLSPLTIYQSLCFLANGASDEKLDKFLQLLNLATTNVMNVGVKSVRDKIYAKREDPSNVDFAGSLWHVFNVDLLPEFMNEVVEPFYSGMFIRQGNIFQNPPIDGKELNTLVETETSGRISSLIPQGLPNFEDNLLLADAMYVKPRIELPCEGRQMDFYKNYNDYFQAPAVEIRGPMSIHYHQETGVDIFTLPYLNGAYKIIFVKSFDPIDMFLNRITGANAKQILINLNPNYDDKVVIPKFKLDLTMDTKTLLEDLDFTDIFDQEKADLSKLSSNGASVTSFKHRSTFSFNDDGCSATFKRGLNDYPLIFDGEFAFFVVESHFFTILLSGKVTDPREPVKPTPGPPGPTDTSSPTPSGGIIPGGGILPPGGGILPPGGGILPPGGGILPPGGGILPPGGGILPPGGGILPPGGGILPPGGGILPPPGTTVTTTPPPIVGPPGGPAPAFTQAPLPPGIMEPTTTPPPVGPPGNFETTTLAPPSTSGVSQGTTPASLPSTISPSEPDKITESTKTPGTITTVSEKTTMSIKTDDSVANTDLSSNVDTTESITNPSKSDDSGQVPTKESVATTKSTSVTGSIDYQRSSGVTIVNSMIMLLFTYMVAIIIV